MRAIRLNQWGQPVQLEDIHQPTLGDSEVLVYVRAASINPIDWKIAAGYLQGMLPPPPMTLGTDFSGDVAAVGADVSHVQPGDTVYGLIPIRGGAFADYAVAKANEIALKPKSIDYIRAAALPLAALVAWQMLFDVAHMHSGERLLIQGAAGDVGSYAVQFAKNADIHVIGTCSRENVGFLQGLGVDEYINYEEQSFESVARDVDAVLDAVGGDTLERSYRVLKRGGRLVTIVEPQIPEGKGEQHGVRAYSGFAQPSAEHFAKIAELVDDRRLKVFVNRTFPLEEAQIALDMKRNGKLRGKLVLAIN